MNFIESYYPRQIFEPGFFASLTAQLPLFTDVCEGAKAVEELLIRLFKLEDIYRLLQLSIQGKEKLALFHKRILQKTIPYKMTPDQVTKLTPEHFRHFLEISECDLVELALTHLDEELIRYCGWRMWSPLAPPKGIFHIPSKPPEEYPFSFNKNVFRTDFNLCDAPLSDEEIYLQASYCLYCHKNQKDSCRKGLGVSFKKGCPLDLPISEMNLLYAQGHPLAALALMMAKNPLILITGHRICNDCMQSCIYQNQEPVNVPAIESHIARLCLDLPWGLEIIYLLSYWNPLYKVFHCHDQPWAKEPKNILVVGMGPAGFTAAHQLLSFGHRVVGIEGLPLGEIASYFLTHPLKEYKTLESSLEERVPQGFGGVMEYGITARWNKNLLTAIRLMLERHPNFSLMGSQFFGKSFSFQEAFDKGFQHVTLALGAGKPKIPSLKNNLAKGVYLASDFLMSLHQGWGFKESSSLKIKLKAPVVIIGGGLTAMDAATEALALLQSQLVASSPPQATFSCSPLVTVVYRKPFKEAPSLQQNPYEVKAALQQGVKIQDNLAPVSLLVDEEGEVKGLECTSPEGITLLPAKSVILATGTLRHSLAQEALDLRDSLRYQGKISLLGDLDPAFQGSVVKAVASGIQGALSIHQALEKEPASHPISFAKLKEDMGARLKNIHQISPGVYEITLHAPFAARSFQPGQFFRLSLPYHKDSGYFIKPLALSGIKSHGPLLTLLMVGKGPASQQLCQLPVNTAMALMGPTGRPSFVPQNKRVLLMGERVGNAILLPLLKAMKENGCYVGYIAAYGDTGTRFYQNELQRKADRFCLMTESLPHTPPSLLYEQEWAHALLIGTTPFMRHFYGLLKEGPNPPSIQVAVNTSMFCMMQGVCGQCLQKQITPTGEEKWVFSCADQDQPADWVDFSFLEARLSQRRPS